MPKQRFESLLANYCAPALKQYKYANMFHLPKDDDSIRSFIKQYNQQFNSKGIFFILIEQETQYTIYVYNSKLKDYISSNAVQNFLKSYQYPNTFELCIQELKKRLNTKNFPHEIGVFLGYPLDDVIGFIEHKPYYLVGDWKVYQNVNEAKKQFDLFKQTKTSVYKGYKQDKIEMRGDRAEMSDFPLYLNMVASGLDCRDQAISGFSFVVKIYAVPVVEIIG